MEIISNRILQMSESETLAMTQIARELKAQGKDVISLSIGEPDFDTPWHIRDEGIYAFEKGKTFYTSNSGLKNLKNETFRSKAAEGIADGILDTLMIMIKH